MTPSSTSNSKTLVSIPWPTKPVVIACVIIAIVRGIFVIYPEPIYPLARDLPELYFQLGETQHLTTRKSYQSENSVRPRILILGSSRHFKLPSLRIANALKLEQNDVAKYAVPASSFFSMSQLVQRHPEIIQYCEVAIIDILPAQLDVPLDSPEQTPLRLQRTTLEQKGLFTQPRDRVLAHADFIFPFLSMTYSSREWFLGITGTDEQIAQANSKLLFSSVETLNKLRQQRTRLQDIRTVLRGEFPSSLHSPLDRQALFDLLNSFPSETSILLVRPPYRDEVEDLIRDLPDRAKSQKKFRDFIETIDHPNVELLWIERASDIGLSDHDYNQDGAHLSQSGLEILSDYYVNLIRERGLLKSR